MKRIATKILLAGLLLTNAPALIEIERTDSFNGGVYNLKFENQDLKLTTFKNIKNEKSYKIESNNQVISMTGSELQSLTNAINQKLIDSNKFFVLPSKLNEVKYGNTFSDDMVDDFMDMLAPHIVHDIYDVHANEVSPVTPNLDLPRPLFGSAPADTIRRTFDVTTQYCNFISFTTFGDGIKQCGCF